MKIQSRRKPRSREIEGTTIAEFEVDSEYLRRFDVHQAGSNKHLEYWIPAADLAEFNLHIRGEIRMIGKFTPQATR